MRVSLLAFAVLAPGCDQPPPKYFVDSPILRLIPDKGIIGTGVQFVFLQVELSASEGGLTPRTVFVHAEGATSIELPGPRFCALTSDAAATDSGVGLVGDGGTAVETDGSVTPSGSQQLVLPYVAFRHGQISGSNDTGILLQVPAGTSDIVVTATAYRAPSDTSCAISDSQLDAFAAIRIPRTSGSDGGRVDAASHNDRMADTKADQAGGSSRDDGGVKVDAGMADAT